MSTKIQLKNTLINCAYFNIISRFMQLFVCRNWKLQKWERKKSCNNDNQICSAFPPFQQQHSKSFSLFACNVFEFKNIRKYGTAILWNAFNWTQCNRKQWQWMHLNSSRRRICRYTPSQPLIQNSKVQYLPSKEKPFSHSTTNNNIHPEAVATAQNRIFSSSFRWFQRCECWF